MFTFSSHVPFYFKLSTISNSFVFSSSWCCSMFVTIAIPGYYETMLRLMFAMKSTLFEAFDARACIVIGWT